MSRFFIDKSALSYRIRARAEDRNWRGPFAEVAELVDALGSGPSGGNTVGVRVPSSAPASLQQDSNRFSKARTSNPLDVQSVFRICKRSEEHTSELQSLRHLVCRLLLEK